MLDYGDLLRDKVKQDDGEVVTKIKLVEQLGKEEMRLSGLVDQRYLDDCLAQSNQIEDSGVIKKTEHISAFVAILESQKSLAAMPELGAKRQKT